MKTKLKNEVRLKTELKDGSKRFIITFQGASGTQKKDVTDDILFLIKTKMELQEIVGIYNHLEAERDKCYLSSPYNWITEKDACAEIRRIVREWENETQQQKGKR